MAGYDETDFPVGDFARIITGASSKTDRRARDLEKLDAASKQRVVPRVSELEARAGRHEARMNGLDSYNLAQDNRLAGHDRDIGGVQATANDARSRAINAQSTANSAYNRTTDLYNRVADLRRRIEILERK